MEEEDAAVIEVDRFNKTLELVVQIQEIFYKQKQLEYELLTLFTPEKLRHDKAQELDKKKLKSTKEQKIIVDKTRLNEPDYLATLAKQQQEASDVGLRNS